MIFLAGRAVPASPEDMAVARRGRPLAAAARKVKKKAFAAANAFGNVPSKRAQAMASSSLRMSTSLGSAPMMRSTSCPSLKTMSVGMLMMR